MHWDNNDLGAAEDVLRRSLAIGGTSVHSRDVRTLNLAHVLFARQEASAYREAIRYYSPLVDGANEGWEGGSGGWDKSDSSEEKEEEDRPPGGGSHVLDVPAAVLANLCVAYIMTNQNEDAKDIMRRIERDEDSIHRRRRSRRGRRPNANLGYRECVKV